MHRVADLVVELAGNSGNRIVVAMAAYPRSSATGELEKVGHAIEEALSAFLELGGRVYRIMHAQGIATMAADSNVLASVQKVCAATASTEVEMRALIVHVVGARDSEWLDDLLGDISVRRQFGEFSRDPTTRLIDGNSFPSRGP